MFEVHPDGGEPQGFGELPHKPRPELETEGSPHMSESPALDQHRTKSLELAIQGGGTHTEVVIRANAYHEFLIGKEATGKPAGAVTGKPAAPPKATSAPAAPPKATSAP